MKKKENFYEEKNLLNLINTNKSYDKGLLELNLDNIVMRFSLYLFQKFNFFFNRKNRYYNFEFC